MKTLEDCGWIYRWHVYVFGKKLAIIQVLGPLIEQLIVPKSLSNLISKGLIFKESIPHSYPS